MTSINRPNKYVSGSVIGQPLSFTGNDQVISLTLSDNDYVSFNSINRTLILNKQFDVTTDHGQDLQLLLTCSIVGTKLSVNIYYALYKI